MELLHNGNIGLKSKCSRDDEEDSFLPTSRIFLPTFETYRPFGVSFCPDHFAHFPVQVTKRSVLWSVGFFFVYVHIPERGVWLLSKEQRLEVVFWAKWDPKWAKWDPPGQFVWQLGNSALELGKKNSIMRWWSWWWTCFWIQKDSEWHHRQMDFQPPTPAQELSYQSATQNSWEYHRVAMP